MPELPEVEATRRKLARWSRGRTVADVRIEAPSSVRSTTTTRPSPPSKAAVRRLEGLVGQRCGPIERHGKRLAWWFDDTALLLHFGMTGRWVRRAAEDAPPAHARVGLGLDDGHVLWFADPRRFGSIVPLSPEAAEAALHTGLGPDALDAAPTPAALAQRLSGRTAIKVALLDQARLAGLGNMQSAEALFRARIHPAARAADLDAAAWRRLARAIPAQLEHVLGLCDEEEELAYLSDGRHVENPFEVYGREGEPCRRCGTPIEARTMGGRATFFCPSCQPAPDRA